MHSYYIFWTIVGGLIYFQMSAVAAVMYENHRVGSERLQLTSQERRRMLVLRTLWFAALPIGLPFVLWRYSRSS